MSPLRPGIECYGLDIKYLPKAHVFGQLDPSRWQYFVTLWGICGVEV